MGLAVSMLSVTGVVIWARKQWVEMSANAKLKAELGVLLYDRISSRRD